MTTKIFTVLLLGYEAHCFVSGYRAGACQPGIRSASPRDCPAGLAQYSVAPGDRCLLLVPYRANCNPLPPAPSFRWTHSKSLEKIPCLSTENAQKKEYVDGSECLDMFSVVPIMLCRK